MATSRKISYKRGLQDVQMALEEFEKRKKGESMPPKPEPGQERDSDLLDDNEDDSDCTV
jgi:hypothetical protein